MEEKLFRIAICNLQSYSSSSAIHSLIRNLHGKVVLICESDRYGIKRGSFWQQLKKNLRHSGFHFTQYLAFNFLYFPLVRWLRNVVRPDAKEYSLKRIASKYGIPYLKTHDINSADSQRVIEEHRPDVIITFHFDQILGREVIGLPRIGVINVHSAVLPDCRGPFPVLAAEAADQEHGFSIHMINDTRVDTGPILASHRVLVGGDMSCLKKERIILEEAAHAMRRVVADLEQGRDERIQYEPGTYFPFPHRDVVKNLRKKSVLYRISDFFK